MTHRSKDDAFPDRQSVETIELDRGVITRWSLLMKSGAVTEDVVFFVPPFLQGGTPSTQTLRSFDETTGAETGSESFDF